MSGVGKPHIADRSGILLLICGGALAALGSLISLLLLLATSRATPVYSVASGVAFALGGIVGYLLALRGFARVGSMGRGRVRLSAAVLDVLALVAPWLLAAITGTIR